MAVEVPRVMTPSEAAELSGLPAEALSRLIRDKGYLFTPLRPGGQPGDRGRSRWGLTAAQLAAIVEGEQRRFVPRPGPDAPKPAPGPAAPGWKPPGGKSRLKHKRPPERG